MGGQLGLEKTPELYLEKMVEIFREVRRVLRDDGTLWVNMGDSYAQNNYGSGGGWAKSKEGYDNAPSQDRSLFKDPGYKHGLKPKDLCGMPWRLALALQADGWWLRSDIIWAKPNPMPESVTDRPTKSHEYLFLLTKKAKYFYDAEAVKEPSIDPESFTGRRKRNPQKINQYATIRAEYRNFHKLNGEKYPSRNLRDVWTIPTHSFPEAHFATFPPKLVEPCVKAGTSEWGCCPECGAGWVRVVEKEYPNPKPRALDEKYDGINTGYQINPGVGRADGISKTLGWKPACKCGCEERVPGIVLDPFMGAGTTALVAKNLGRKHVGIELNADYIKMANNRLRQEVLL